MSAVLPIAKALYFCDDLRPDSTGHKVDLVGAFSSVRVPYATPFPYRMDFCVVVQLTAGIGTVPVRVDVVRAATNAAIHTSGTRPLTFPGRRTILIVNFRLSRVTFPSPGGYVVELFCHNQIVDDRLLRVVAS